jgi:hypothetical protein
MGITPGRVAYVFYTKKAAFDKLKTKPGGYERRTGYGTAPIYYEDRSNKPINPTKTSYFKNLAQKAYSYLSHRFKGKDVTNKWVPPLA